MVEAFAWASPAVFDLALGYDERQARGKPHFAEIAEFFGCSNPDMLFVGDSLFDAEIATRHGVPFIALTGTLSQVDFVSAYPKIRCISDIADIVEMTAAR
jgi:phosphoglycolate phosphatase-like HAD superfamily hydrolase